MLEKIKWEEMVKVYPNEWIALIDYEQKNGVDIEGVVVAHDLDKKLIVLPVVL